MTIQGLTIGGVEIANTVSTLNGSSQNETFVLSGPANDTVAEVNGITVTGFNTINAGSGADEIDLSVFTDNVLTIDSGNNAFTSSRTSTTNFTGIDSVVLAPFNSTQSDDRVNAGSNTPSLVGTGGVSATIGAVEVAGITVSGVDQLDTTATTLNGSAGLDQISFITSEFRANGIEILGGTITSVVDGFSDDSDTLTVGSNTEIQLETGGSFTTNASANTNTFRLTNIETVISPSESVTLIGTNANETFAISNNG